MKAPLNSQGPCCNSYWVSKGGGGAAAAAGRPRRVGQPVDGGPGRLTPAPAVGAPCHRRHPHQVQHPTPNLTGIQPSNLGIITLLQLHGLRHRRSTAPPSPRHSSHVQVVAAVAVAVARSCYRRVVVLPAHASSAAELEWARALKRAAADVEVAPVEGLGRCELFRPVVRVSVRVGLGLG
jgi:hypothetical protein